MKKQLLSALIVAFAASNVLFTIQPSLAQTPTPPVEQSGATGERRTIEGDKSNIGGSFVLRENETLAGDLAVLGGTVKLEPGSIVEGDVTLLGGSLTADGEIMGDVTQLGGNVSFGKAARVEGKFDTIGGSQKISEGAYISQGGTSVAIPAIPAIRAVPTIPAPESASEQEQILPTPRPGSRGIRDRIRNSINSATDGVDFNFDDSGWSNSGKVFPGLFLITLLAMIIAAVIPRNIMGAVELARTQPILSGGVGFLSLIAGGIVLGVTLLLIITFFTNPLIALAAIGVGWTVTARIVGEWIMGLLKKTSWQPLMIVIIGSVAMALAGSIEIVGDLLGVAFVSVGLGAFILTRGGTRPYQITSQPYADTALPPSTSVNNIEGQ